MTATEYTELYAVLGVRRDATDKQITSAFRKLALRWHPDHNPGDAAAAKTFAEIHFAYEVLTDSARRAEYDRSGRAPQRGADNSNVALMTRLATVIDLAMQKCDQAGKVYTAVDMVGMMKEILHLAAEERIKMRASGDKIMAGYRRMLGRFKKKTGGDNVMESLIKGKIVEGENHLKRLDEMDRVDIDVGDFLAAYGYRVDLVLPDPQQVFYSVPGIGETFVQQGGPASWPMMPLRPHRKP